MLKWLKGLNRNELAMLVIIVMLLAGIILRWNYIKKEAGDAIMHRVDMITGQNADTTIVNSVR